MSPAEVDAVAKDLGVDSSTVVQMEGRLASHDMPYDGYQSDDEVITAPAQYLDDESANPAGLVAEREMQEQSVADLGVALKNLDERSRDILEQRWLSDSKSTLHELAKTYQVSAERIRQLEKNAMKKIRASMDQAH